MAIDCAVSGIHVQAPSRNVLEERFHRLLADNRTALGRLAGSYAKPYDRDDLLQEIAMALWRAHPRVGTDASQAGRGRISRHIPAFAAARQTPAARTQDLQTYCA